MALKNSLVSRLGNKTSARGKAAGRAPQGAFVRASKATRGSYAQLNALSKGKGAKGARSAAASASSGGGGA